MVYYVVVRVVVKVLPGGSYGVPGRCLDIAGWLLWCSRGLLVVV